MKTETTQSERPTSVWLVVAAFATVYVVWGSTYLGIRYAVESIPPFLMAGMRNVVAGSLLFVFARLRGGETPTRIQWRDAAIAGCLMLLIGNGGVTWAEKTIPSGVASLLVALTPAWMVVFDWLRPKGVRPGPLVVLGIGVGFAGVALLARNQSSDGGSAHGWGVILLMVSSIGWALGSIFNRSASKPASLLTTGGMQLIAGGVLLLAASALSGELKTFSLAQVSLRSFGSWLYLMLAGSLVSYTAYVWLLQVSTPARVSTSAYVNPLIAVLLGSTIGREPLSSEVLAAGVLIIISVVFVLRGGASKAKAKEPTMAVRAQACPSPE